MSIIRLLRPKHYIKNLLIFLPLFFNGSFFTTIYLKNIIYGFVSFCLLSSSIYIINDINDINIDRLSKKNRPLAKNEISVFSAYVIFIILLVVILIISLRLFDFCCCFCLLIYFIINIFYSIGLKNIPIVDVAILTSGFIIRIIFGSLISKIMVSNWLYLTVFSFSFFFALCKRRNELKDKKSQNRKRKVLKFYNETFLDKNMYMFLCMAMIFYSLWTIDVNVNYLIWTVPFVFVISLRYTFLIEICINGDPIEVMFSDRCLKILVIIYLFIIFILIYV